jgi:hypothetical protein
MLDTNVMGINYGNYGIYFNHGALIRRRFYSLDIVDALGEGIILFVCNQDMNHLTSINKM